MQIHTYIHTLLARPHGAFQSQLRTSPQRNSIGTTLEPSLTRNLKVANKDCGA